MGSLVGAIGGSAKKASKKQVRAALLGMNQLTRAQDRNTERIEPFREAGVAGFDEYLNRLGIGEDTGDENFGQLLKQFTGEDVTTDPGYQFGLEQGERGINNRLAGSGNFLSGAGLKEISRYNQDYGGTKFNEAYNRDALDKGRIHDYLQGIGSVGLDTTNYLNQQETGTAQGIANLLLGMGNAQASGVIGNANAWSNVINQGLDILGIPGPAGNPQGGQGQIPVSGINANLGNGGYGGNSLSGGFFGNSSGNLLSGPKQFEGGFAPGSLDPSFFTSSPGGGGGGGGGGGMDIGSLAGIAASIFSDRRLKTNIKRIGTHPLGVGVYEYLIAGKKAVGVMADELKKVMPEAVTRHSSGYDMVDYSMIGGGYAD